MPRGRFHLYTFLGSWPWCFGLAYLGMKLGENWRSLGQYFHKFDAVIGVVLLLGWRILCTRTGGTHTHRPVGLATRFPENTYEELHPLPIMSIVFAGVCLSSPAPPRKVHLTSLSSLSITTKPNGVMPTSSCGYSRRTITRC